MQNLSFGRYERIKDKALTGVSFWAQAPSLSTDPPWHLLLQLLSEIKLLHPDLALLAFQLLTKVLLGRGPIGESMGSVSR